MNEEQLLGLLEADEASNATLERAQALLDSIVENAPTRPPPPTATQAGLRPMPQVQGPTSWVQC